MLVPCVIISVIILLMLFTNQTDENYLVGTRYSKSLKYKDKIMYYGTDEPNNVSDLLSLEFVGIRDYPRASTCLYLYTILDQDDDEYCFCKTGTSEFPSQKGTELYESAAAVFHHRIRKFSFDHKVQFCEYDHMDFRP